MKKSLTFRAIRLFLIYVLMVSAAAIGAYAGGVVFRQYLRVANALILTSGFLAVLVIWNREIPTEQKKKRTIAKILTFAVVFFVLLGMAFQIFMENDKETVILKDGEKKVEVESSWIMHLERSYYDYKNIFWYTKNPHCTECYDDGDPYQLVYTDYYNADGNFTDRIFEEK